MNRLSSSSSSGYLPSSENSSESESSEQLLAGAVGGQSNQKASTGKASAGKRSVSLAYGYSQLSAKVQTPVAPRLWQRVSNKSKPELYLHIYPRDTLKCSRDMIEESVNLLVENQIIGEQSLHLKKTYHKKFGPFTVRFVGNGTFSQVLAIHKREAGKNNKIVSNLAVKITRPEKNTHSINHHIKNEINILPKLDYDHIVQIMALLTINNNSNQPVIFMEYGQIDLLNYLQTKPQDIIDKEIPTITLHASKGIAYLHDRGIIHRDIKQENLLRDPACVWKWCDFGFSMILPKGESELSDRYLKGTREYLAPEICFDQLRKYSIYSDRWALAMLRMEIAINNRLDGLNNTVTVSDEKTASFKAFIDYIRHIEIDGCTVDSLIQEVSKTPETDKDNSSKTREETGVSPHQTSFYNISCTIPHHALSGRISKVNYTFKQVLAILTYFSLSEEVKERRIDEKRVISILEACLNRDNRQAST